jgi:nucleoside-diphosphate-sugar epimerase
VDTFKKETVLVTGGQGFVGRAVVKLLRREAYRVVTLDQSDSFATAGANGAIVCDISDAEHLRAVFEEQCDRKKIANIIHLAAILPTVAQRDPARATRVNIEGSLHLLEMARQFGVRRFVFGSSLSVYGTWPPDKVISETDRAAPQDLYGIAKLYVEQLGALSHQHHSLEFVSLRIGRVLGEGAQSATSAWRSEIFELLHIDHPAEIVLPYEGSERILVTHVDDVARMLLILIRSPQLEHLVYNAPCESLMVADLKREIESLNPKLNVKLGSGRAIGNPARLDCCRFEREFGFSAAPIFAHLKTAAG